MKRRMVIVAIGLGLAWGAAQAERSPGWEVIKEYASTQNLEGASVDKMWIAAWDCYSEIQVVMAGAELKALGVPFNKAKADLEMDDDYAVLAEKGYQYQKPTDINIGSAFAQCLNDAHKQITSK